MRLLYIGDPMCSWCWGFAPTLRRALEHYRLDLDLLVGGLRPGVAARPLDEKMRSYLARHWSQVERVSGQPFDRSTLERQGWLYDTEPACRAVVAARRLAPERSFELFESFQRAFYRDAVDLTDPAAYRPLVAAAGVDPAAFVRAMESDAVRTETYEDFALTRRLGVQGFPEVLLFERDEVKLRLGGYRPFASLAESFGRVGVPLRGAAAP